MKASKALFVAVLAGISAITSVDARQAEAATPTITRLTNNSSNDISPKISGSNVIWSGNDGKYDQLFFYDGKTTTQLSNNGIYTDELNVHAEISGSHVVWSGYDDNVGEIFNDTEIFLYDGKTTRQLTNNSFYEFNPQISGSKVVWSGSDGNDSEIFLYNGKTITQLTNNSLGDYEPQVSGSKVAWSSYDGNDSEIFLYDGKTITQLTNNNFDDIQPQLSGSRVVWKGGEYLPCDCAFNFSYNVFLYNGKTTTQLTNSSLREFYLHRPPQISGSNVVWFGSTSGDDDDNEIFFYNGRTTTQLTNNSFFDGEPQISGSKVVWTGIDSNNSAWDIFLYDGRATTQLTNNSFFNVSADISGLNVVWAGYPSATSDPNDGREIFLATNCYHRPVAVTISALGLMVFGACSVGLLLKHKRLKNSAILTNVCSWVVQQSHLSYLSMLLWSTSEKDEGASKKILSWNIDKLAIVFPPNPG